MAFHDAFQQHEKKAIQSLTATKLMAPVIDPQQSNLCDPGQRMYQIHAIQRFRPSMKDLIFYQYIPAETKFTFANGETAKVNWTLHLKYHTTPPASTSTSLNKALYQSSSASASAMRNLYITIEHTDKITCKAFGMNRQAVPVSILLEWQE